MNENEFLKPTYAQTYAFAIYQILDPKKRASMMAILDPKRASMLAESKIEDVSQSDYSFIYASSDYRIKFLDLEQDLTERNYPVCEFLDDVFRRCNIGDISGHFPSLSVGDVIVLNHSKKFYAFLVQSIGFEYIPSWKYDYLEPKISNQKMIQMVLSDRSKDVNTAKLIRYGGAPVPSRLCIQIRYPYFIIAKLSLTEFRVASLANNLTSFDVRIQSIQNESWLYIEGITGDEYSIRLKIRISEDDKVFDYSTLDILYYYKNDTKVEDNYHDTKYENLIQEFIFDLAGDVLLRKNPHIFDPEIASENKFSGGIDNADDNN